MVCHNAIKKWWKCDKLKLVIFFWLLSFEFSLLTKLNARWQMSESCGNRCPCTWGLWLCQPLWFVIVNSFSVFKFDELGLRDQSLYVYVLLPWETCNASYNPFPIRRSTTLQAPGQAYHDRTPRNASRICIQDHRIHLNSQELRGFQFQPHSTSTAICNHRSPWYADAR